MFLLVDFDWTKGPVVSVNNASVALVTSNVAVVVGYALALLWADGFLSELASGSTASVLIEPTANSVSFTSVRFSSSKVC